MHIIKSEELTRAREATEQSERQLDVARGEADLAKEELSQCHEELHELRDSQNEQMNSIYKVSF